MGNMKGAGQPICSCLPAGVAESPVAVLFAKLDASAAGTALEVWDSLESRGAQYRWEGRGSRSPMSAEDSRRSNPRKVPGREDGLYFL